MSNDEGLVIELEDFRIIQESDKFILGYLWEQAYLIEKEKGKENLLCEFYGVCDSGLISYDNKWVIVGGDIIAIWRDGVGISIIDQDELKWVDDLRQVDDHKVEVLVDPWSKQASIWLIDIFDLSYLKVSDFDSYRGTPYTEKVVW